MVGAQSLGHPACEAKRPAQSQGCSRSKACCHSAPNVDRRDRVQLVDEEGRRVTRNKEITEFPHGREKTSLPDDGGGEIARFFASSHQRDCACNIDPPASSYAIMRRAGPYRGENSGPGKDDRGELDTETRN